MLQEAGHIKNTVVLVFWHIQCLHLLYSGVAWVLISSGTQVQPRIIIDLDNFLHIFLFLISKGKSVAVKMLYTYINHESRRLSGEALIFKI